jgi:hypothetical protein
LLADGNAEIETGLRGNALVNLAFAKLEILRIAPVIRLTAADLAVNGGELLRVGHGEWPQEHRANYTEYGGDSTNSKSERKDSDSSEREIFAKHAESKAQILQKGVHGPSGTV